jgi:TPR repeat protein
MLGRNALAGFWFAVLATLASQGFADTIILKAGQRIEGDVKEKGGAYEVTTAQGTVTIPKTDVARIARSVDVIETEAKALQDQAKSLYEEASKLENDTKAANDKLRQGVELLRKAVTLYQDAREVYTEGRYARMDQAMVRLFQEMRLFRDKMHSELVKAPEPEAAPKPEPKSDAKEPAAPTPEAKKLGEPAKPDLGALVAAAKGGDLEAMFAAGRFLEIGDWSAVEAMKWLKSAADKGHPRAQALLGLLALEGRGNRPDPKEATKWLFKAEAKGEPLAKVYLAWIQFRGIGGPRSLRKADELCEHAAVQLRKDVLGGDQDAEFALGWMHLEGMGIYQSLDQALALFRSAASKGSVRAAIQLGRLYDEGRGVEKDLPAAAKWYGQAAERGFAEGQYEFAWIHDQNDSERPNNPLKDFALSRQWYDKAIAQGYPVAMYRLGNFYLWGKETAIDGPMAIRLFQQAIQKAWGTHLFDALNNLGLVYAQGKGVPRDLKEASKYFRMAAEGGSAHGQYNMGVHSLEQKDDREAMRWWRLAARNGHSRASFEIGDAYFLSNHGMKKDLVEAERWFLTALQLGDKDAPRALSMVREEREAERKGQKK